MLDHLDGFFASHILLDVASEASQLLLVQIWLPRIDLDLLSQPNGG